MKVYIRKDNLTSIAKAKSKGFMLVGHNGDLLLYEKKESYVEKIKAAAQKVLGYVQINSSNYGRS